MTMFRVRGMGLAMLACASCAAPPVEQTDSSPDSTADDGSSDDGSQSHDDGPATGDGDGADDGSSRQDASVGTGMDAGDGDAAGHEGGAFPFPQSRSYPHCQALDVDSAQVRSVYERWRNEAVVADGAGGFLRVRRWEDNDDTVSEGLAYGMIAAVYMNDPSTFDALWQYGRLHANANGLTHWRMDAAGQDLEYDGRVIGPDERGGATDADEDMAWALVMAHYQWGGHGSLARDYLDLARDQIAAIWSHEVDHNGGMVLKPGDRWGGWNTTNPSYFAPAYYRVFASVSGNDGWKGVIESSYAILQKAADPNTGLVPAWCNGDGANANMDFTYQYDACRTPFRIALDYCLFGEARAGGIATKIGSFFRGVGASAMDDGYDLSGHALSFNKSMAFIGPAGSAGLVTGELSSFATDAYAELLVLGQKSRDEGYSYYNASWGLLSQLFMSGNFLDFSQL
jgi:endo-1,4-beta-D-glucanase Y